MSGFDLTELLPFYLDETEEQIGTLNDALLRLEGEPADDKSLREAFRIVHSIKGSSTVMGLEGVSKLTHHLETFFDQLRAGQRLLERPALNLFFRCLDELRDYHRQLRSDGQSQVDLSGLTKAVIEHLESTENAVQNERGLVAAIDTKNAIKIVIVFDAALQWPDMKAKLVLNRISSKARVLSTVPHADHLEEIETLRCFTLWIDSDLEDSELHQLSDVEGVVRVSIEHPASVVEHPPTAPTEFAQPETASLVATESTVEASEPSPEIEIFSNETVTLEPSAPLADLDEKVEEVTEAPVGQVVLNIAPPEPAPSPIPPPPAAVPAPATSVVSAPAKKGLDQKKPKVAETVRVDVDRLDSLMNLAGELVISRARFFEISKDLEGLFRESNARTLALEANDRIDEISRGIEGITAAESAVSERLNSQFRRLRENFMQIYGELDVIRQGRELVGSLIEVMHQLSRVADGIQKGVLETRMVPIGPLFERFHRVIRDLRVSSGKEVTLHIDGESTELDKRMIDELGDPLIHMVRNSVDHGLEAPETREAAGKSRTGNVWLAASHRGNSVVITVRDDGKGIDCERVRQKAVGSGLVSEDESRRLTEKQLVNFIWHPGLSTAEKLTDISGRGVGMDIVKSRIENLNGTVDVKTELGKGTTFSIRLPLTLAIMPALLVRIYDEVYAIPQDHVDEIVEVTPAQVYKVHGMKTTDIRGKIISLVRLDDVFVWGGAAHPARLRENGALHEVDEKITVVVVQNGETTIGLSVDDLIGMQEIVLKSLVTNYRSVPCLSGASVLGDGRVALILDVDAIIERSGLERELTTVG